MGGGLWLAGLKAVKADIGNERAAAAVLLGVLVSLFAAGFPTGWLAGERFEERPLPVWLSMGGAYLIPVVSWFAGLEPAWPAWWAVGLATAFVGSWVGLGLGLFLVRRRRR